MPNEFHPKPAEVDCPASDINIWSGAVGEERLELYRALRDLGPVVWLERQGIFALTRFDEVRTALSSWQQFSSAKGVALDEDVNAALVPNVLMSDGPEHREMRRPLSENLSLAALKPELGAITDAAGQLVDAALVEGTADGVLDLARPFSLQVVCDLVGFPEEGREGLPDLAEEAFNVMGAVGERLGPAFAALHQLGEHALGSMSELTDDGIGRRLVDGGMPFEGLVNFTWPGIDTTVNGVSAALLLLAQHPEQWRRLRADRELVPQAFAEALRLHTPVHSFTRWITEPVEIGGVELPADHRVVVLYGSANRDERHYPDPDQFDIDRNPSDQLAFGRGVHLCVGIHLARLEGHAMLNAVADRVETLELGGEPKWVDNTTLHGLARLPLRLHPAGG
jgi:cytochrome P450